MRHYDELIVRIVDPIVGIRKKDELSVIRHQFREVGRFYGRGPICVGVHYPPTVVIESDIIAGPRLVTSVQSVGSPPNSEWVKVRAIKDFVAKLIADRLIHS